jgi:hypothetical protein
MSDLQECDGNVGARVDEADQPRVILAISSCLAFWAGISDAKSLWEAQVGTIRTTVNSQYQRAATANKTLRATTFARGIGDSRLIPTLNSCGNGVEDNGKVEDLGMSPSVSDFTTKDLPLAFVELRNMLDGVRALSDKSSFLQEGQDVLEVVLVGEILDILKQCFTRNASKRVADSIMLVSNRKVIFDPSAATNSPVVLAVN